MIEKSTIQQALGTEQELPDCIGDRFSLLEALVLKWNPKINIVANSTLDDIASRHIVDSIQAFRCCHPDHRHWLDIGSGGGFPGLVVAILAASLQPKLKVTLVESDKRKAVFLREASRQMGLIVEVLAARIEDVLPQNADVISARALAPLDKLLGFAERHLGPMGVCAFLKGAASDIEVEQARKQWVFDLEVEQSITDARSSVLFLRQPRHV